MSRLFSLVTLLLAGTAASTSVVAANQLRHAGGSFVSTLKFKITLRICNAYPYGKPMDIYLGKEKLTTESMPYKKCGEFAPPLKDGDKLDFKVGDSSAGTFSVSGLPQNDAVLVLIIHRHDPLSTAVSFESHVFANLLNAQVAVIDTYKGAAASTMKIQDKKKSEQPKRSEELRYDSVVAVNQGPYEVALVDIAGTTKAKKQFVAVNRESYLLIRVGVETQQGPSYPQELIIYPETPMSALGGAKAYSLFAAALATLLSMAWSL